MFSGDTDGQGLRRALVAFNVADSIPAGSNITDVSLLLHCSRSNSGNKTHTLHVVTQEWDEGISDAGDPGGGGSGAEDNDATWCYRIYNKDTTFSGQDFAVESSTINRASELRIFRGWAAGVLEQLGGHASTSAPNDETSGT